tara:strand:- start:6154 stop:7482 length:1329 start_codon:yes stop_codon:yes gene_type:complete
MRKPLVIVVAFFGAFVIALLTSSPANAQTDVVIEHNGICHDAAWFASKGYVYNGGFSNSSIYGGVWEAESGEARFHAKITNNSAAQIEAYITIPDDGVVGPLYNQSANVFPMQGDGTDFEGGSYTFLGNRTIAPGATSYIEYGSGITNGPEDVIVHIIQDGTEYSQTPVTRSCTADMAIENWQVIFGANGLSISFNSDAAKVIQWSRTNGTTDNLVELIPMLQVLDENGVWQRVIAASGGFSAFGNDLEPGFDAFIGYSSESHSANLWEQYPALETANICDSTTPVTSRIVWASEENETVVNGTLDRPIMDLAYHEFTIDPTDWHDDCQTEGFETPDLCQYDANFFADDPACVAPTPTPAPTVTPTPAPTVTPTPDPDQDNDGIKDGDEIEGCVLDPDPGCDIEELAATGISTNRLLLYAFALMGLASTFMYSGRVFRRESS